jgi:outer membrane protein insertion porin family
MRHFRGLGGRSALAVLFASFAIVLAAPIVRGQGGGPPIIKSIDVQFAGPATVSKERILAQIRTAVGQPYSDQVVEDDIRNLYKTGGIQNVRIFAQPEGEGVKVIVAVQTRAIIREIVIDGAQRIKAKRLRKEITVKLNSPVNEDELQKSRQKIIDHYQARGFTDVNVEFRVEPIDETRGTARVIYTVQEGARGAVRRVEFQGNEHFSDKILRKQMKTRGKTWLAVFDKSGRLDEAQLQQDLDKIKEFYQNHGYIDAEVKDVRKERQNGPLVITIAVTEGIQYHVNKLTFSGFKETTEQKLRGVTKMKEGSVYSPKGLHDDAKAIADAYGSGGYVDLVVLPQSKPVGSALIDVHYKIEEGTRSFVERINIIGNTRTKDKVIRREILIRPGDVFNTVRVEASKKRLENLGYFTKVDTYPEPTGVEARKDLVVQVEEKRTGSLNFGAGYSTIDQLVGFVELTQGNFDIMNWPGFTGAGQKFRARAQVGNERKDFVVALTEPWFLDQQLSLGGQLFYSEADYLSAVYDTRDYGGSIELRKPLFWFMYGTLGYRYDKLEVFNVASGLSPVLASELQGQEKSEIYTSLVYDRRDNPFLTRRGERIAFSPYVAGGFLGGNDQIYGWDLEASKYFHLWWDMILLFNAEAGTVDTWGNDPEVRIFDRLFLGGSNNLRGFDFRAVSPKDANNEPLGGQSMARATVELTFPIVEKARGALFYDTGFVNPDSWDFNIQTQYQNFQPGAQGNTKNAISYSNLESDVGIGLRLDLPIGPLRLDWGFPVERGNNPGHGRLNFSVGYQF